jgi:hypothetical protein
MIGEELMGKNFEGRGSEVINPLNAELNPI